VVADILEVPIRADVAGNARTQHGVLVDGRGRGRHRLLRRRGPHVGERQALGGEAHARAAGVLERAAVAAHAVVVGDAAIGTERQLPAARGGGHVHRIDAALADQLRQQLAEQLAAPEGGIEPKHRHLLLDFAVAAQHREAGSAPQAAQDLRGLARHARAELLVLQRIVEVGEHEVLPHEHPQLVAQVVERARLIRAGTGQAQHVHARLARLHYGRAQIVVRRGHRDHVERRPNRSACEHAHPVDVQVEPVALDVVIAARPECELAKAHATRVDDRLRGRSADQHAHVVQGRLAVRVRPPPRNPGHRQLAARGGLLIRAAERELGSVGARRSVQLDLDRAQRRSVQRTQSRHDREHPDAVGVDARAERQLLDRDPPPALHAHGSPRADGGRPGCEAGRAAHQHRAKEAEVALGDQLRAPARAWATRLGEQRRERAAADRQLVVLDTVAGGGAQARPHLQLMGREHRVAVEHALAVEVHLGHRRDAVQAQAHLLAASRRLGLEARAKPPVLRVEVVGLARPPLGGVAKRAGGGARHARGHPAQAVQLRGVAVHPRR